jgi:hypothetical protein
MSASGVLETQPPERAKFGLRALSRWTDSRWEWLGIALFVGLLIGGGQVAVRRMVRGHSDFHGFYQAGRWVLEHRERAPDTILAYYWPSLDVAWSGLAWMPQQTAAVVWYVVSVGTYLGLLYTIATRLLADWPAHFRRQATLAAGLLMMPLALNHFCLGAFHLLMLWLMVAGLVEVADGRWRRGGVLLGLAIWIKLLPLLAAGYLVWKRQWKPALLAVVTALVIDVAVSVGGLGPATAWNAHVRWWHKQVRSTTSMLLDNRYPTPEYRSANQSPAAVMRRALSITWVEEPDGRANMYTLVQFSPGQLKILYRLLMAGLGAALAVYFWGPAWRTDRTRCAVEIALLCLCTMWFSPIAWSYHFLSLTPALAVILLRERYAPLAVWSLIGLWGVGLASLGSHEARSYGVLLFISAVLAVAMYRLGRFRGVGGGGVGRGSWRGDGAQSPYSQALSR